MKQNFFGSHRGTEANREMANGNIFVKREQRWTVDSRLLTVNHTSERLLEINA